MYTWKFPRRKPNVLESSKGKSLRNLRRLGEV